MNERATLKIAGMTCEHCVHAVRKALLAAGVTAESVGIGVAVIAFDRATVDRGAIDRAVGTAGYSVESWTAGEPAVSTE